MAQRLGRYELLEQIGEGGFAVVYRGRDTALDREVALKVLKPVLLRDTTWTERFRREAKLIARLDHLRITPIYDVDETDDGLFIVMRLVNGPSLADMIATRGRLPWSETVSIITAIAVGLDYAHKQGVLHRDLKPANILLDPERGPLLTDFGMAKFAGDTGLSSTGDIVGTPHYIAPEIWEGQPATSQADIFALGCVLFEMLVGEKVFPGETPLAVMKAHLKGAEFPQAWPEDVPPGVADLLSTALAKEPAQRFTAAPEMTRELAQLSKPPFGTEKAAQQVQDALSQVVPQHLARKDDKASLSVGVLGELQVLQDDIPVQGFESDKVRALLAYLAVEAAQAHRRETLLGLLWPDYPEEAARHNLRQALYNLRLALGDHTARPPYLLITRESIQFNRESDYSLDLDQFNTNFSAWEENQGQEGVTPAALVAPLEEMVQLYRGEFLEHFFLGDSEVFEDWILVQREALHRRVMKALTTLANEYEHRADYQTARRYAWRQLELDPWREEAHGQMMRLLALDGQRSTALAQYETCRRVLAEELGVEPSPQTRDLYERIRSGTLKPRVERPTQVPAAPIHNLPLSLTPFIGREQELAELGRLLAEPECRCLTLVGPGGIGKTRLALQAADQQRNEFAQGTAFIPLASVDSVDAVISAIASGINLAFYGPIDPKDQLLNYLREKQLLLVVDNVEHLLVDEAQPGTIAELLIEILQQAEKIKLLVTSRELLNLQGEWPFEVQGLAFPGGEQADGFDEYSAVALFVQRARRARPGFELNVADKAEVVRLCRLVEGMPLAIELAATWVRILSPPEIAAEVEHSLDFLNAQMRDLPERHRSMRAVFEHSWQMLSTEEKQVLGRLSVFRGGFSRQAAEQVAGASLPLLSSLVIRSLLRRTATGRYDLHELIRQYAASKLAEDPHERHTVQERHSLYYLDLLAEKEATLKSHHQREAMTELSGEMDNIRLAWDWSIAEQRFIPLYRVSATLMYLFELRNWYKEGEVTFQKTTSALRATLSGTETDPLHQVALYALQAHYGFFLFRQGRGAEAYAVLSPGAAFLRTSDEPLATIYSLIYLGIDCWILGRFSEGRESLQESLRLAQHHERRWYEAWTREFLGSLALDQGEYNQARGYLSKALVIIRQLGDPSMTATMLRYLAKMMRSAGEYGQAEKLLRESLELAREMDYRFAMGLALDGLGQVAYAQGRHEEARTYFLETASLFREMGANHGQLRTLTHQGLNSLALSDTTDAQNAFQTALRMAYEGGFMSSAFNALAGLAALETSRKASQGTLELVLYILQHPSSIQETKDLAARLRAELESRLTQEEIEAARERAGSMDLDELVRQFMDKS